MRTLIKIILEYDDGSRSILDGPQVEEWKLTVNSQAMFCASHNIAFPDFNWTEEAPQVDGRKRKKDE